MATKPFAQIATASDYRNIKQFVGFAAYWRTMKSRGSKRLMNKSLAPLALFVDHNGNQYGATQRTLRLWAREARHMVPNAPLRDVVLPPAEQMWALTRPLEKPEEGRFIIPLIDKKGTKAVVYGKGDKLPIVRVL